MREEWRKRRFFQALVLGTCFWAWAGSATALTDEEIFRQFRFNLVNPGARALGMAGAQVAIADDGYAVQANPAGLFSLERPQYFAEYRSIDEDLRLYQSDLGSLDVDPGTGARDLPFLGLASVSDVDQFGEFSFAGIAWPLKLGRQQRRLTVAASVQTIMNQDRSLSSGEQLTEARFAFEPFPNTVNNGMVEAYSVATQVEGGIFSEILYWNASAALEVNEDFSVGITVSYATLDLSSSSLTSVNDPQELFVDPGHPRLPAQPSTDLSRTIVDDSDTDFAYTLGVHWHPDSIFTDGPSPWSFGAVYRKGAGFEVAESTFLNEVEDGTFSNHIVVPDRYGLGAVYSGRENWLVTFEIERVEYSDMLEGFQSGMNYLTSGRVAAGAFDIDDEVAVEFTADDSYVPRVGVEYSRVSSSNTDRRLALWAGYYRAPDSQIRMSQFNSEDPEVNATYLDAFRGGEDVDHYTAGIGYSFRPCSVQLAGDLYSDGNQVVASFSCSFN
jgi:hypothetical protein